MTNTAERTVSARWLRRLVRPAYHDSWAEAERALTTDPLQRQRIAELEAELAHGAFDRPIVLEREHWWSLRPTVRDGVHRCVAAMRAGGELSVRFGYDESAEYDHSDVYRVTLQGALPDGRPVDELDEMVLDLASFRCSAGPWIQCDTASGPVGGPVDIYLARHPDLRMLIAAELQERLHAVGVDAVVEFLENRADD